ncbi:hypothetical protein [Neorhodopirellula lusitana]|uniref:hypothetical protein n=1 Tax=Neorhodopirellula lusitana TaxID=445327 RepID=UPI00384BFA06
MVDCFAKTPQYVLKDGAHPTCPALVQPQDAPGAAQQASQTTVLFGFSDKPEYDAFLAESSLALTPYPLVKGFLTNQIELAPDALKLIVLDAASPNQATLNAATLQTVLDAMQSRSDTVAVSHHLILEESSSAYRAQE